MGYYTLRLDLTTSDMCTIIFPWGKYSYQRLPMGASNAPDVFQAKMGTLFQDLEYVRAYIDDLLILSSSTFEDHLDKLGKVLQRLQEKVCVSTPQNQLSQLTKLNIWDTL